MTMEADLFAVLGQLVGGRAYPDFAPIGVQAPYMTYFQAGGTAVNYLESTPVGKRNARMQINCSASTRMEVNALARAAEDALMTSTLKAFVIGALSVSSNSDLNLYNTRQDFSIWY